MDGASAIIFNSKKQLLLTKRQDLGVWTLPGGGIEDKETPEKAIVREVEEEVMVDVKIQRKLAEYTFKSGKINHLFICVIKSGTVKTSNEVSNVGFFDTAKLPRPYDPLLPQILRDLQSNYPEVIKKRVKTLTIAKKIMFLLTKPQMVIKYLLKKKQ